MLKLNAYFLPEGCRARFAAVMDGAGGGFYDVFYDLDCRCFAGTIGTKQTEADAGHDAE